MKKIKINGDEIEKVKIIYGESNKEIENHITIYLKNKQVFRYVPFLSGFCIIEGTKNE